MEVPTPVAKKTFFGGFVFDEKAFEWVIKNFDVISKRDAMISRQLLKFDAGEAIDQQCTWIIKLRPKRVGNDLWVGVYYGIAHMGMLFGSYPRSLMFKMCLRVKDQQGNTTWKGEAVNSLLDFTVGRDLGFPKVLLADNFIGEHLLLHVTFRTYFKNDSEISNECS